MAKGDFLGEFEIYVMLTLAHLGAEAYGVDDPAGNHPPDRS